jgi:transmembrane sensor
MEKEMNKMEDVRYLDLIGKHLSGNIAPEEEAELMRRRDQSDADRKFFDEMIRLWSISADYDENFDADIPAAWMSLEHKLAAKEQSRKGGGGAAVIQLSPRAWIMRAAAAILLLVAVGYWWYGQFSVGNQLVAFQTGQGEKLEVELPDGSRVWLNETTRISYLQAFREREVELEGEAFFEVEKMDGKQFAINSGETRTIVLGTSFNVRAYPAEAKVEVTVETGVVRLEKEAGTPQEAVLEAGNSGVYDKESREITVNENKIPNAASWKTRRLAFDNILMKDVVTVLQRFYGIDLQTENPKILNCHFKLDPAEAPELETMLGIMEYSMDLEIEKKGETYVMSGNGCE